MSHRFFISIVFSRISFKCTDALHFKQDNMTPCFLLFSWHKPVTSRLWYPSYFIFTSRLIMCQHLKEQQVSAPSIVFSVTADVTLFFDYSDSWKKPLQYFLPPLFHVISDSLSMSLLSYNYFLKLNVISSQVLKQITQIDIDYWTLLADYNALLLC